MEKEQIKQLAKMICNYCEEGGELPEPQELEGVINDFITKEQEPNILYLKWGNINGWDSMPVDLESYKLIRELEEREEKLREGKGGGRREHWDKDCLQLCLRAIQKLPENRRFINTFSDKEYTKEQAIDYIINYEFDY